MTAVDFEAYSDGDLATVSGGDFLDLSGAGLGTLNVLSGQVVRQTVNNDCFAYYATVTGSNDNWSEATVSSMSGTSGSYTSIGVCARVDPAGGGSAYFCGRTNNSGGQLELYRISDGSFSSLLGSSTLLTSAPAGVLRLDVTGTTVTVTWDGVEVISITNSDVTTGQYTGLYAYTQDGGSQSLTAAIEDWQNNAAGGGLVVDNLSVATSLGAPTLTQTHELAPANLAVATSLQAPTLGADTIPAHVQSASAAITSSRSPSVTFSGYTPQLNDLVILWASSTTTGHTMTEPSGWTNPLGAGVDVESDSHQMACAWHLVTSGEVSAVTTTYTATNWYGAATTGYVHGMIVRPCNASDPVDAAGSTFSSTNTVTPHVLATITSGNVTVTDGLVCSSVAKDGTGTYTAPGGWTERQATNTNHGRWTGTRDTRTTAGSAVAATNITPSAGDEYASITLIVAPAAGTITLTVDNLSVATSLGAPTLTQTHVLAPVNLAVATSLGTVTLQGVVPFPYAAAVDGRKLVDQDGNVVALFGMSAWTLTQRSTEADMTTALEDLATKGYNFVLVNPWGNHYGSSDDGLHDVDDQAFFVGSLFSSSFGPAWDKVAHFLAECRRLHIIPGISVYTGAGNTQGMGTELIAAGTTAARTYGQNLAAYVEDYPEVLWHIGADQSWDASTDPGPMVEQIFRGIQETQTTARLQICEPQKDTTGFDQFMTGDGFTYATIDVDSVYHWDVDSVDKFNAVWDDTTVPVGDCEPRYRGNSSDDQELRERIYATFIRGGCWVNYGDEAFWPWDLEGTLAFGDWETALANVQTARAGYAYTMLREHVLDDTWAPNDSLIATGTGTGSTKAAGGASDTTALAYIPSSRSLTVNTTVIAGTSNVRLRWYDPTDNAYTTIASSEAQSATRSVTHPGTNAGGDEDWLLVVDIPPVTLAPNDLAVVTSLAAPALVQTHVLTPGDLSVLTSLAAPALVQTHELTVGNLSVATSLGAPSLAQTHDLDADDLAVATSLSAPTLAQTHGLDADDISVATSLAAPALAQTHLLAPASLAVATILDAVELTSNLTLTVADISVATSLAAPTLVQTHELASGNLAVATSLGAPTLVQTHELDADDLAVATSLSSPTLTVVVTLTVADLSVATSLEAPTLTTAVTLVVDDLRVATGLESPAIGQTHVLDVADLGVATALGSIVWGEDVLAVVTIAISEVTLIAIEITEA